MPTTSALSFRPPLRRYHIQSHCGVCYFKLPTKASHVKGDWNFETVRRATGEPSENNWKKYSLLAKSAARGCTVCASLVDALQEQYGDERPDSVEEIVWKLGGFHIFPGAQDNMDDWDVFMPLSHNQEGHIKQWTGVHPYAIHLSQPSGDTGGIEAQKRLRSWISRCDQKHDRCGGIEEKPMPRRLLLIENHNESKLRLVQTDGKFGRYACLSHRWCSETETASLTKTNFDSFEQKIPSELIYPLLRDVIKVAGQCNLDYIWIDCMCIIQDDKADWAREAASMASIYSNASITIAATGCDNGVEGLFRSPSGYRTWEIGKIRGQSILARPRHVLPVHTLDDHPSNFPLLSRGWIFQEFKLSKRIIHFTKEELIWQCTEATWCECDDGTLPTRDTYGIDAKYSTYTSEPTWDLTVAQYSRLSLTRSSDRLPGIGGIARQYAEKTGQTYLAGLWREGLEHELLWVRLGKVKGRPNIQRAPTWSWASINSPIGAAAKPSKAESLSQGSSDLSTSGTGASGGGFYGDASRSISSFREDFSEEESTGEDFDDGRSIVEDPVRGDLSSVSVEVGYGNFENPGTWDFSQKIQIIGWEIQPIEGGDEYGCLQKSQLIVQAPIGFGSLFNGRRWHGVKRPPILPTSYRTNDSWCIEAGKINFYVQPDYDFSQPGPHTIESGTTATFMQLRIEDPSFPEARGIVLRCVDEQRQLYERIGYFTHGFKDGEVVTQWLSQMKECRIIIQ